MKVLFFLFFLFFSVSTQAQVGLFANKTLSAKQPFTPQAFAQQMQGIYTNDYMFRDSSHTKTIYSRQSIFPVRHIWQEDSTATWVYFVQYMGKAQEPMMSWLYEIRQAGKDSLHAKMYLLEGTILYTRHSEWTLKTPFADLSPRATVANIPVACELYIVRTLAPLTIGEHFKEHPQAAALAPFAQQRVLLRCLEQSPCNMSTIIAGASAITINFVVADAGIFSDRTLHSTDGKPLHRELKTFQRADKKRIKEILQARK